MCNSPLHNWAVQKGNRVAQQQKCNRLLHNCLTQLSHRLWDNYKRERESSLLRQLYHSL